MEAKFAQKKEECKELKKTIDELQVLVDDNGRITEPSFKKYLLACHKQGVAD